jgi:hypothetical protein
MSNNEQTQKSLSTHLIAKQQKTLDLSKNIIAGTVSIAPVEMQLTIQQTFDKALIKSVFKGEAGQIGFSVVNVLVTRFIDSFGFSTKLNPTQIETLTVDILENFQYETLEDIIIFLKMARTGKFGSTGRGVDSNLILGDWFPKYLDKKAEIREQNYQVEKTQFINNNSAVDLYYKNIQKKKEQKKIFDNMISDIDKMVLNMDRTMLEETILDWSKKDEMKPYLDYLKRKRLIIK